MQTEQGNNKNPLMGSNGNYDAKLMKLAKKRTILKRTVLWHLLAYIPVNALCIGIYFLVTPEKYFWPVWSILGWGVGLAAHGIVIFCILRSSSQERGVLREYERLKQREKRGDTYIP